MGMQRVKEALEANDWAGDDDEGLDFEDFEDDEEGSTGFAEREAAEMMGEMFEMKRAIYGGRGDDRDADVEGQEDDDEISVEQLEAMMLRLQAVKGMFTHSS